MSHLKDNTRKSFYSSPPTTSTTITPLESNQLTTPKTTNNESCALFFSLLQRPKFCVAEGKNPERVAAGLKATINRPNVSQEAKQRATERLQEMGKLDSSGSSSQKSSRTAVGQVMIGEGSGLHDDAEEPDIDMSNPDTNRSAKSDILESGQFSEQEEHRIIGGYKASLKNPHVSESAKEHAKEVLEDNQQH
ncbi:hypothetical protein BDQ12DRAFT_671370 [Crucibulum laeve]|uniref:Conidiation protein 6-domain-containing protein n=1 Tax=Crucibulum laeve TaxID=68775 RepID=A0A5C3LJH0_9AGAR|nr:hypothetical protein BDQ12DRAFT_671370 [Crucibulum laeve]